MDIDLINKKLQEGIDLTEDEKSQLAQSNVIDANITDLSKSNYPDETTLQEAALRAFPNKPLSRDVSSTNLSALPDISNIQVPQSKIETIKQSSKPENTSNDINLIKQPLDVSQPIKEEKQKLIPQESIFSEDLSDKALKDAQEKARLSNLITGLIKGGTQLGSKTPVDVSAIELIEKQANQPIEDILQRRKSKLEQDIEDPNSPTSKLTIDFLKKLGYEVPKGISAGQLKRAGIDVDRMINAKEASESRKLQRELLLGQKEASLEQRKKENLQKASLSFSKALESDQELKEFKKQGLALGQVDGLIKEIQSGNTIAANALGAKMARAMGEVGVLTENDVSRYIQSGMLTRGVGDKLKKLITGKPSDATLDELQQISTVLQNQMKTKVQPIYDKWANRLSRIHDMPIEDAYYTMDIPVPKKEEISQTSEIIKVQSPEGKIGSIPKANLDKAIKRGFKVL